jgi:hypothetical protein
VAALELGGVTHKLEGNADKIGLAVGLLGVPASLTGGNVIGVYGEHIKAITSHPHIPNFEAMFQVLTNTGTVEGQYFIGGIEAAVLGWILQQIDIHPMLARIGRFAQKAGIGTAEGTAIYTAIEFAGIY